MWVVDTCVILDVLVDDPQFGKHSATFLQNHMSEGLVLPPFSYVELAPAFQGHNHFQDEFLDLAGVEYHTVWTWAHTQIAHHAWQRYCVLKRQGVTPKRPLADILIGAFATKFQGLITRNDKDFKHIFPELKLLNPLDRMSY